MCIRDRSTSSDVVDGFVVHASATGATEATTPAEINPLIQFLGDTTAVATYTPQAFRDDPGSVAIRYKDVFEKYEAWWRRANDGDALPMSHGKRMVQQQVGRLLSKSHGKMKNLNGGAHGQPDWNTDGWRGVRWK